MSRIAIMQPYFFPYAGYYRLIANADIFVVYDCVQFPKRGWVHRNKFTLDNGQKDWLTLPLENSPRSTLIKDKFFKKNACLIFSERIRRFISLKNIQENEILYNLLFNLTINLTDYLMNQLQYVSNTLGFKTVFIRSSSLKINSAFSGEDRIIQIVKKLEGTEYINSPGGKNLYSSDNFSKENINLSFLNPYEGSKNSFLERFLREDISDLVDEIESNILFT